MKIFISAAVLALLTLSCATKEFVDAEIAASEQRTQDQIEDVKQMVEETQTDIKTMAKDLDLQIEGLENTTKDLNRKTGDNSEKITRLSEVKFQKTLSDAGAYFKSSRAELSDKAKEELDKFGKLINGQNKMLFIEIQGHTDNLGKESYNLKLGEKRAMAVRNYLYSVHDIPLHVMSVISLGESQPVADNGTSEGRAQNRRVVIVVRIRT